MILNVLTAQKPVNKVIEKALADIGAGYMVESLKRLMQERAMHRMFAPIDPLPDGNSHAED